ncbi:hypothetical protein F5148DRAFT_118412 [Russula earlei]|uniref:Uncharacterized protein n=1 Tax=Russula earlei TaxID=71964 RepID=A0ACC0TSF0_9AGAM|nr:hypothetical protein F5148DRAFT_118412 [Russula earlei]
MNVVTHGAIDRCCPPIHLFTSLITLAFLTCVVPLSCFCARESLIFQCTEQRRLVIGTPPTLTSFSKHKPHSKPSLSHCQPVRIIRVSLFLSFPITMYDMIGTTPLTFLFLSRRPRRRGRGKIHPICFALQGIT